MVERYCHDVLNNVSKCAVMRYLICVCVCSHHHHPLSKLTYH